MSLVTIAAPLGVAPPGRAAPLGAQAPAAAAQDASIRRVRLAADTVVDGIHCAPTGDAYAEFHANGRLAECPLAEDATVGGHAFPRETWVILDADGRLSRAWLSRDTRIGAITCKGTGYKDWITEFHADGSLRLCFLPENTTIQGIPCRGASIFGEITGGVRVRFHPNGRLASCALARGMTIDGERRRRWTRVDFDAEGPPSIQQGSR